MGITDWTPIIVAVVAALLGGGGGGVIATVITRRKVQAEASAIQTKSEVELSDATMRLVDQLRTQLGDANAALNNKTQLVELERAARIAAEDRERKIQREGEDRERAMKYEIAELKATVATLQRDLAELRSAYLRDGGHVSGLTS